MSFQEMTFRSDRTRLSALVRPGRGPALVLVPGAMSDAAGWLPVATLVSEERPLVVLNRRGRPPSGPLGDSYTVQTEIDDLHALIAELDTEIDLFGWSYGGLIASEVATGSKAVRSLMAYEPVSGPFGAAAIPGLQEAIGRDDLDRAVELVNLQVSGFTEDHVARLRRTTAWPVLRPLAAPVAEELAAINDFQPHWQRYAALDIPVTLLVGEQNQRTQPYGVAFHRFVDAMPQARLVILRDQGHLAHAEAPHVLAAALNNVLNPRSSA